MGSRLNVMISSTAFDLPEHRKQVIAACEKVGMFPLTMENSPADPADAAKASLRMVDEAHLYVGIFAHRYGYVPPGSKVSVTEMEYERARKRQLDCYIFFMHEDHSIRAADKETGPGAKKLERLKRRLKKAHVICSFKNSDDLRAQVIHSLSQVCQQCPEVGIVDPPPKSLGRWWFILPATVLGVMILAILFKDRLPFTSTQPTSEFRENVIGRKLADLKPSGTVVDLDGEVVGTYHVSDGGRSFEMHRDNDILVYEWNAMTGSYSRTFDGGTDLLSFQWGTQAQLWWFRGTFQGLAIEGSLRA